MLYTSLHSLLPAKIMDQQALFFLMKGAPAIVQPGTIWSNKCVYRLQVKSRFLTPVLVVTLAFLAFSPRPDMSC